MRVLARKLWDKGFSVSAIGSAVGKSPIEEDFSGVLDSFRKALKAAEIFKAPYVRAFSFYLPGDSDPMRQADEVVSRLSEMAKMAAGQGLTYALENERGLFSNIPERCAYVLERVPQLRMAFDPGNFVLEDADTLTLWSALKPKVAYFHIKDGSKKEKKFVPAGEGDGQMDKILKDAFDTGFKGVLSIEPHLGYLSNLNKAQQFTVAANALKTLLNRIFNAGLPLVDLNDLV
jgi:sugar phosphate isomerase/epimerase